MEFSENDKIKYYLINFHVQLKRKGILTKIKDAMTSPDVNVKFNVFCVLDET